MRHRLAVAALLLLAAAVVPFAPARAQEPGEVLRTPNGRKSPPEVVDAPGDFASLLQRQVELLGLRGGSVALSAIQREVVAGDVAHYTITIPTGPGTYDRIRVHRVVRETRPGRPLTTVRNLFYQHGDLKDFVGMMLPGLVEPSLPRDFGLAAFLARDNVDVWGIDQDWTLVPESESDVSFMATWGLERARDNLALGIAVARVMRLATGSGGGPMLLAGYSSGDYTAAALLTAESRLPAWLRQVAGYVNIDVPLKSGDPALSAAFLADHAAQEASIAAGQYGVFLPFRTFAELASSAPDEPSPFAPGLTNHQLVAYVTLAPGGTGFPAPVHYWAGQFDETGFPTGPSLTPHEVWLDFMKAAITWQPARFFLEYDAFALDPEGGLTSPFDDRLGDVDVPVLNVEANGGLGTLGDYGMSFLGSHDVQRVLVTDGAVADLDVGHVDLFTWEGSRDLFWRPLSDWIRGHATGAHAGMGAPLAGGASAPAAGEEEAAAGPGVECGLHPIASNPAHGPFDVAFALPSSEPARLEILDVSGRRVESLDVTPRGGLQHARVGGAAHLAPGVYLVRLSQADRQWSRRVAVVGGR